MKQKIVSKSADQQQGASSQSKSRLLLDLNSFTVVVGAASDSCAIWTAVFDNEFHEKPRSSRGSSSCSLSNRQIANLAFHSQLCLKFIQGCCSGYTIFLPPFFLVIPWTHPYSIFNIRRAEEIASIASIAMCYKESYAALVQPSRIGRTGFLSFCTNAADVCTTLALCYNVFLCIIWVVINREG